jgi:phosphoglycolate phosphatase-like HAD superfamily hydrolase
MLVLFDIDATLITTKGAGIRAMVDAGQRLHGPGFGAGGVEFAGRLDPLILADLLRANGVDPAPAAIAAMRRGYAAALAARLGDGEVSRPLPGVPALIARLASMPGRVTTGLLTGNFAETGSMKLQAAGLDPEGFVIRVWGDDSPHDPPARDHLPGVALERVGAVWGRPALGGEAVVIGDTPHDIACARAHGCRVLAVATGKFGRDELAHADETVDDLGDVERIVRWLMD